MQILVPKCSESDLQGPLSTQGKSGICYLVIFVQLLSLIDIYTVYHTVNIHTILYIIIIMLLNFTLPFIIASLFFYDNCISLLFLYIVLHFGLYCK